MDTWNFVSEDRLIEFSCSLIRHQYGKHASMEDIMDRMGPGVPSTRIHHECLTVLLTVSF